MNKKLKDLENRVLELERRHNMTDGKRESVVAVILGSVLGIIFLVGLVSFIVQ